MTFFDIPPLPLPPPVTERLARRGLVTPDRADRVLAFDPLEYPRDELASAEREWADAIASLGQALEGVGVRPLHGADARAQRRALLRQVNARFSTPYRFFRMVGKLWPGRFRVVLGAPRLLRAEFRARGIELDERISALAWLAARFVVAAHAVGRTLLNLVAALGDGVRGPAEGNVYWAGLSEGELGSGEGDLNALDFVRERRLPLFAQASKVYVAAPWLSADRDVADASAVLAVDPLRTMPRRRRALGDLAGLLKGSVQVAARIVSDIFREDGLFLILAAESATLPRMRLWLASARPKAILTTNSFYLAQPLWHTYAGRYGAETVMLFYSTNSIPLYESGKPDPVQADPGYRLLDCSLLEVWTEGQKEWLVNAGVSAESVHTAGIIVWSRYDAFRRRGARAAGAVRVSVFDVVPMSASFWMRHGIGEHYYDYERMAQLLADVVAAAREIGPVEVVLKSKRPHKLQHDRRYWDVVAGFVDRGELTIYPPGRTPLDAVADSDAVVSAPFSSPSVIAREMNIPSCYYDPAKALRLPPVQIAPDVPLISGADALHAWLDEKLGGLVRTDGRAAGRGRAS